MKPFPCFCWFVFHSDAPIALIRKEKKLPGLQRVLNLITPRANHQGHSCPLVMSVYNRFSLKDNNANAQCWIFSSGWSNNYLSLPCNVVRATFERITICASLKFHPRFRSEWVGLNSEILTSESNRAKI